jgi:hypothetical protein
VRIDKLLITFENAKLKGIWHYSLPSGWTCPGALNCLTKTDRETGKVTDKQTPGADGKVYRCYAAGMEGTYPSVRKARWNNFDKLKKAKTVKGMTDLICDSIPEGLRTIGGYLRVHVGGDFFSYDYFDAWMEAAKRFPRVTFYSYTKSVQFLARYLQCSEALPSNYVFTVSTGSKFDHLIDGLGVKTAKVVFSQEEADALGLDIDHTDEHAIHGEKNFGLFLHGIQPKGSKPAKALRELKKKGFTGYKTA